MSELRRWIPCVFILFGLSASAVADDKKQDFWALKPVIRPEIPSGTKDLSNPIDTFIAVEYKAKGLIPASRADARTLLRRLYFDLIGIPPTPAEQEAFLQDSSPQAYEKVVDQLLANEQHGVRYARRWLDVLRYADLDERMIASPGIHLWRDWVINALNSDMPYDQFVRTQLTGYRSTVRTQMAAVGVRTRVEPRPEDLFALGFLSRSAVIRDNKDSGELAISAVETVSTAFLGMTVGCAKCHDHFFDPISQRDFYAMKALFDPLVVRKVLLGTSAEMFAQGKALNEVAKNRDAIEVPLNNLIAPYKKKLYDERVAMLPADVQPIILKLEKDRTSAEQKIADDYFPILRIDSDKFQAIMPEPERKRYQDLQKQLTQLGGGKAGLSIPAFWTVEVDRKKETEKSYILTSGDPERPELHHEVQAGWPFAPSKIDFREGRIETFADWLTAPENPLFARVAVNRLWQWHFGTGLQKTPSDFGSLGGTPTHPQLLDWLASEFASRRFSMKEMHKLIVTSETYKLASAPDSAVAEANRADANNTYLWHFRLQRLEAEPIWDAIFTAAGNLDLTVGGPSFDIEGAGGKRGGSLAGTRGTKRRAVYMARGYSTNREAVPAFLQTFDVEDGRAPCPLRTQTVTPPQALFMMNNDVVDKASSRFAERLQSESGGDLKIAVDLAYRTAIARPPSPTERDRALEYLRNGPDRLKGLAWLLFNLDEFIYIR